MTDVQPTEGDRPTHTAEYGVLDAESLTGMADSLLEAVVIAHRGRLLPEQLDYLRIEILRQLTVAERLHQYPLTNADEPAFQFAAYDGER